MKKYALWPKVEYPKYVFPMSPSYIFEKSLDLYIPFTIKRRIQIEMLKNPIFTGIIRYYPYVEKILSSELQNIIPYVNEITSVIQNIYESDDLFCAFYISNPAKYVVQIMDQDSNIVGYAKVSVKDVKENYTKDEYDTLCKLSRTPFKNFDIPRVRDYIDNSNVNMMILHPPSLAVRMSGLSLKNKHIASLIELFKYNMQTVSLNESVFINRISARIPILNDDIEKCHYEEALDRAISNIGNKRIKIGFCHCDFKPWNIKILSDDRLYIYDWEAMCEQGIPLWDYFHFALQVAVYIKRTNGYHAVKSLFRPSAILREYMNEFLLTDQTYFYLLLLYIIDISTYYYCCGRIREDRKALHYVTELHHGLVDILKREIH